MRSIAFIQNGTKTQKCNYKKASFAFNTYQSQSSDQRTHMCAFYFNQYKVKGNYTFVETKYVEVSKMEQFSNFDFFPRNNILYRKGY